MRGQTLPGLEQSRDTVCTGDDMSYLATCTTGFVIAVKDIQAGANLVSNGCPPSFNETADPSCCRVKTEDCTFR